MKKTTDSKMGRKTQPNYPLPLPLSFGQLIEDRLKAINGLTSRNAGRGLINVFFEATGVIHHRWTKSRVKLVCYFAFYVFHLVQHSGLRGAIIKLKASQVLLMQSVARYKVLDITDLKVRVKRTRGAGIPTIIPAQQRSLIRAKDVPTIRFWMTLFGLYRVLSFPSRVTWSTITDPCKVSSLPEKEGIEFVEGPFWEAMKSNGWVKNLKEVSLLPIPFPIAKSSPSTGNAKLKQVSTSPWPLHAATLALMNWEHNDKFRQGTWFFGGHLLLRYFKQFHRMASNLWEYQEHSFREASSPNGKGAFELLGKLGQKVEPAGKVRVFAMVDAGTQWIMEPLHRGLFSFIRQIPQDGTFDQLKPVNGLIDKLLTQPRGKVSVYSIDLSAATDRLPIILQMRLLVPFLMNLPQLGGASKKVAQIVSSGWRDLLVGRDYQLVVSKEVKIGGYRMKKFKSFLPSGPALWTTKRVKIEKSKVTFDIKSLRYAVGQPMGALSSWAMLAFTHHAIVQWAGFRVTEREKRSYCGFEDYAVLGDDIVIANKKVAKEYLMILKEIGVEAGLAKSLVSHGSIVLEFAKKFRIPESADMIPFKEVISARLSTRLAAEFAQKYRLTGNMILRFYGYGYKVRSGYSKDIWKLPLRVRVLTVFLSAPGNILSRGKDAPEQFDNGLRMASASTYHSRELVPYSEIYAELQRLTAIEGRLLFEEKDKARLLMFPPNDEEHAKIDGLAYLSPEGEIVGPKYSASGKRLVGYVDSNDRLGGVDECSKPSAMDMAVKGLWSGARPTVEQATTWTRGIGSTLSLPGQALRGESRELAMSFGLFKGHPGQYGFVSNENTNLIDPETEILYEKAPEREVPASMLFKAVVAPGRLSGAFSPALRNSETYPRLIYQPWKELMDKKAERGAIAIIATTRAEEKPFSDLVGTYKLGCALTRPIYKLIQQDKKWEGTRSLSTMNKGSFLQDITNEIRLQEELDRKNRQLEEDRKGQLTGTGSPTDQGSSGVTPGGRTGLKALWGKGVKWFLSYFKGLKGKVRRILLPLQLASNKVREGYRRSMVFLGPFLSFGRVISPVCYAMASLFLVSELGGVPPVVGAPIDIPIPSEGPMTNTLVSDLSKGETTDWWTLGLVAACMGLIMLLGCQQDNIVALIRHAGEQEKTIGELGKSISSGKETQRQLLGELANLKVEKDRVDSAYSLVKDLFSSAESEAQRLSDQLAGLRLENSNLQSDLIAGSVELKEAGVALEAANIALKESIARFDSLFSYLQSIGHGPAESLTRSLNEVWSVDCPAISMLRRLGEECQSFDAMLMTVDRAVAEEEGMRTVVGMTQAAWADLQRAMDIMSRFYASHPELSDYLTYQ